MYSWNDIKINVTGSNHLFIDGIKKYINAVYIHEYEGECDICARIHDTLGDFTPPVPDDAAMIKSIVFNLDGEIRLEVWSSDNQVWYLYKNIAEIHIDYENNIINVAVSGMPLDFEYYNILLFFLHPMGSILEGFGFFRLHSSCTVIDGNASLITGISGSGKSTAAFIVPLHGGQIIADDLTYVHKDEEGYHPSSLSALVKLRDDSINRFYPELNRLHSAAHFEDETYFFLADINKAKPENPVIKSISILEKTGKKASSYTEIHPSAIVPQLFPSTIHTNNEAQTGRKFLFITDLLNDLKPFKIDFGTDMENFFNCVQSLLTEASDD